MTLPARRALISVSDKTGLDELGRGLVDLGIEIFSTGGTRKYFEAHDIPVTPVAEVTNFPEILDGRVKTLHPAIHGGILAHRAKASHLAELQEHGIDPIDLVIVNLYPFRETAADSDRKAAEVVEMIDIGGPCMVRAAAKNHHSVAVVVDPGDYPQVLAGLESEEGQLPETMRLRLALKAFRHTQSYDAAIARWFEGRLGAADAAFPQFLSLDLERILVPRYGENPHQQAAAYRTSGGTGVLGGFEQLQGKELSYNNLLDADAARRLPGRFQDPAVVIVKHNNPCGVGCGSTLEEAFERALSCDPLSAFGSIVAVNREADLDLAVAMKKLFVEVVVAPSFSEEAKTRFAAKGQLRLLVSPVLEPGAKNLELRSIAGGFLAQQADLERDELESWTCPTKVTPTDEQRRALELAWQVTRAVKSNAIVITNAVQTLGIGAGQMSRVDSCRLAIQKAQLSLDGSVAGSDAFFPFRDGLDVLAAAGVRAVIQPGGSKRDAEVIAAADEHGIAMIMTGRRHFRH